MPSPAQTDAPGAADKPTRPALVTHVVAWRDMGTRERLGHVKTEFLIGIIVFLTQLPESVAFALLAKLTPPVGLHSAWIIGLITGLFGGRPGMISGAAGARATIIGSFLGTPARAGLTGEGAEIVFPAVIISGFLMLCVYAFKLYRFTKVMPESVMVGFLNGIGVLIVVSQVFSFREDDGLSWRTGSELGFMLLICAVAMLIMEGVPRLPCSFSNLVPSALLGLIAGAILEFALIRPLGFFTNTIGDVAEITIDRRFPIPFFIDDLYDMGKLSAPGVPTRIITLAILLCAVGSLESLLSAEIVTDILKTPNDPGRTMLALGSANALTGLLGGMGGDSTVGLSKMNVMMGGTSRVSQIVASLGILACIMGAYPLLNYIPIAGLTGVMFILALHTFAWPSVPYVLAACLPSEAWRARVQLGGRQLLPLRVDRFDALIMAVVTVVSALSNIVYATVAGVLLACFRFSWVSAHDFSVEGADRADGSKLYRARGELFFGTATYFHLEFDYANDPEEVCLLLQFEPQDYSALHALRKVTAAYEQQGKRLEVRVHGAAHEGGDPLPAFTKEETANALGDDWRKAGQFSVE